MQLPNKLYSYERSTLALMSKVLRRIQGQPVQVVDLFKQMQEEIEDASDFVAVMDCLYALRAVDINENGEVFMCL